MFFSGFFKLLFKISVFVFSLLLLFNLFLNYLFIILVAFGKSPGVFIELIVNISYMPVDLRLVEVVLLAVLSTQLGAVAGNRGNRGAVDELDEVN